MHALERANDVRAVRARLKRGLAASELRAADVLLTPPREAARMEIAAVLSSQRGWARAAASGSWRGLASPSASRSDR